ncbi:MAG: uroporphyrinogen decarboxylase family protein [Spirochaetota bacterium]
MTSRERLKAALEHRRPDRVPLDLWVTPEIERVMMADIGVADPFEMRVRMGHDLLLTLVGLVNSFYMSDEPEYIDPWGITFRNIVYSSGGGKYTEMVSHPLSGDDAKLNSYTPPDPDEKQHYSEAAGLIEKYGETHFIVGGVLGSVFEGPWYLRGMHQFLQDMISNKDYAHKLMDLVMDFHLKAGLRLISMGCDMILAGDDVGTQDRMLISPALWREFIRPRYARLFDAYRAANPEIKIATHICGYIEPIIDDLADVGVDVLNPVQPLAMDPGKLKKRFGRRICFWGAVDDQKVFPFGSPGDVDAEVKLRIKQLAPQGGYILCSSHNLQATTPVENIRAYYAAYKKYGAYPLNV